MKSSKTSLSGLALIALTFSTFWPTLTFSQAGSNDNPAYAQNSFSLSSAHNATSLLDGGPVDADMVPASLIKLDGSQQHVVWVEMERGLLHLMALNQSTGEWQIAFSRPISIGKAGYGKQIEGDNRTPVGLYHVTSFLADEELTDFYGNGAFPINYPNSYDRLQQRTGYGIWLHGLPKGVEQRPLLDSEGCVIIDNTAFDWLRAYLVEGETRVFLGDKIAWTSVSQLALMRSELESTLEDWRAAWSAIDNPNYLGYYASDFSSLDQNLEQWIEYKNRIHSAKEWIDVEVSELNIFAYPGEEDLVVTEYQQNYRSSNFNAQGKKQIFWRRQANGSWKIVFESAA